MEAVDQQDGTPLDSYEKYLEFENEQPSFNPMWDSTLTSILFNSSDKSQQASTKNINYKIKESSLIQKPFKTIFTKSLNRQVSFGSNIQTVGVSQCFSTKSQKRKAVELPEEHSPPKRGRGRPKGSGKKQTQAYQQQKKIYEQMKKQKAETKKRPRSASRTPKEKTIAHFTEGNGRQDMFNIRIPIAAALSSQMTDEELEKARKREKHNRMERMRREELRKTFEKVERVLPIYGSTKKNSKQKILDTSIEDGKRIKCTCMSLICETKANRNYKDEYFRHINRLVVAASISSGEIANEDSNAIRLCRTDKRSVLYLKNYMH